MASYKWPPDGSGGGGGGSGSILAAATSAIGTAQSSVTVSYSSTLSAPGTVVFSFVNKIDSTPIFLQGILTAQNNSGFTVLFNAPTDTANYLISYMVTANL